MTGHIEELRSELEAIRADTQRQLDDMRREHAQEIADLRQQLAKANGTDSPLAEPVTARTEHNSDHGKPRGWGRRALLLGGLGAASGVAAGALGRPQPAQAVIANVRTGARNDAGADSTQLVSTHAQETLSIVNSGAGAGLRCLSGSNSGVIGQSETGIGVLAFSTAGAAIHAVPGSGPAIRFNSSAAVPPVAGEWFAGDLLLSRSGELWCCAIGGRPGSWRLLSSVGSAGAYVPITPVRVYDSRSATPDGGRALAVGEDRVISVRDGRNLTTGAVDGPNVVPPGTKAITVNLTLVSVSGAGFLAIAPGVALNFTASAINWTAPGQVVANGLTIPVDTNSAIKAFCRGGSAHLIVDVTGFFRAG